MILLVFLCAAALAAQLTVEDAVSAALRDSPALAEADAAVIRSQGALRAARGLPQDPTVQASLGVVGEVWSVSVQQPISLGGAGLAERAAAQHALQAAEHQRDRTAMEVAAAARRLWVRAVSARQQAVLAEQALALSAQIASAAAQREAIGEGSQLDARIARLQVEQARAALTAAALDEAQHTAALAALVGMPLSALELPADPLAGAPTPQTGATGRRSDLAAAAADADAAAAALSVERARTLPDVRLGGFVEEEEGTLRAGPRVSVTVPIWRANADGRARAAAETEAAGARALAAERRVQAEQAAARALVERLDAAARSQSPDVPAEARAALESVALGYESGELDLMTTALLQAEIIDGQLAWLAVRQQTAEARLVWLLSVEDPRLLGAD